MAHSPRQSSKPAPHGRNVGRYLMFGQIGAGGTATVHFGRLRGEGGFARTVALKRLHAHLASDPYFVSLFLSEARLAGRVNHPNVCSLLDVVRNGTNELLLVMDYIHGETLAGLLSLCRRREEPIPPRIATAIVIGALTGLHAAHEAVDENGRPLGLVHGDVSPHNIIVGADGIARVLDFGVARAGVGSSRDRRVIGTLAYMAPERLRGTSFDRRSDLFGAGVLLWEMLAMRRLFSGADGRSKRAMAATPPPSRFRPGLSPRLDEVIMHALRAEAEDRPRDALGLARALEQAQPPASTAEVAEWLMQTAGARLRERAEELSRIERSSSPNLLVDDIDELPTTAAGAFSARQIPRFVAPAPEPGDDEQTLFEPQRMFDVEAASRLERGTPTPTPQFSPLRDSADLDTDFHASPASPPPPAPRDSGFYATPTAQRRINGRWVLFGALCAAAMGLGAGAWGMRASNAAAVADAPARTGSANASSPSAKLVVRAIEPLAATGAAPAPATVTAPAMVVAVPPASTAEPVAIGPTTTFADLDRAPSAQELLAAEVAAAANERASAPPARVRATASLRARVLGLNQRGIAAYERLDPATALRLLSEGLRLCQNIGPKERDADLAALSHVNLGIVLAGGFKQRGLAARHFRLARTLSPSISPAANARNPEIEAALAEANLAGLARGRR